MSPDPQVSRVAADDHLLRIVRQHALTTKLLGVDFLPVRAPGGEPGGAGVPRVMVRSSAAAAALAGGPAILTPNPTKGPTPASTSAVSRPAASVEGGGGLFGAPVPAPDRENGRSEIARGKASPKLTPREAQSRLDRLRERYERDAPHRNFVTSFNKIVFGEGDACARLMFVGEAPGAEEDKTGRPFVGRAGQLLEKMIGAMGLKREQVYIANVLKTRPPDNATPTSDEAALCAPYLFEQIAIIRPEVIVTLGLPASRTLLNSLDSMSHMRGRWWGFDVPARCTLQGLYAEEEVRSIAVPVMPTYHPAFLLRSYTKENRQKVWSDLKLVMDRLGLAPPGQAAESP